MLDTSGVRMAPGIFAGKCRLLKRCHGLQAPEPERRLGHLLGQQPKVFTPSLRRRMAPFIPLVPSFIPFRHHKHRHLLAPSSIREDIRPPRLLGLCPAAAAFLSSIIDFRHTCLRRTNSRGSCKDIHQSRLLGRCPAAAASL